MFLFNVIQNLRRLYTISKQLDEMFTEEDFDEMYHLFHLLWGHCRESPEYDKEKWQELQKYIDRFRLIWVNERIRLSSTSSVTLWPKVRIVFNRHLG